MEDNIIVNKIIQGDSKVFEHIIRKYNRLLYRIGISILKNDADAEDAMQMAYIRAYQNLASFENRAGLGTWLSRIMINECLSEKRKKDRFTTETDDILARQPGAITPYHTLMNKELNNILEDAIAGLPEKYRLVFVLREIEEMSVKETQEILNIEESNVKVRLNRAKTMLQHSLNGYIKDNVYSYHLSRCDQMVSRVFNALDIK